MGEGCLGFLYRPKRAAPRLLVNTGEVEVSKMEAQNRRSLAREPYKGRLKRRRARWKRDAENSPPKAPFSVSFQRAKTSCPDACSKILNVFSLEVSQYIPNTTIPYRRYLNVNWVSSVRPYPIRSARSKSPSNQ